MTFAEKIGNKIEGLKKEKKMRWDKVTSNHMDYMRALKLNHADLKEIEDSQGHPGMYPSLEDWAANGFLKVDINSERFVLFIKNVCALNYGAKWEYRLMAVCESNASLNEEIGHGTALISAVPDEWHQKIIKCLKEKK